MLSIYIANAFGAIGHLLVLAVTTHLIGLSGYGYLSLYLLAFAVPLALEPAALRRGVDLQQDQACNDLKAGFLAMWALVWLVGGVAVAVLLATFVFDPTPVKGLAFILLLTGFVDYASGIPILSRLVRASAASIHADLAKIALVQSVSRYSWLLGLLWMGQGDLSLLVLMPLRRAFEYALLRGLRGTTDGGRIVLSRAVLWNLFLALSKYGSIIGWLMLGTEGIGLLVYLQFGDHEFGRYRAIFDVASKSWFVATIFPIVLYPQLRLIERGPQLVRTMKRALSLSFVGYLSLSFLGLGLAPTFFPIALPALAGQEKYFFGVLLGVALVGHARLGLECLQAFGATRTAALLAAGFSFLLLGAFAVLAALLTASVIVVVVAAWATAGAALAAFVDAHALAHAGAEHRVRAEVVTHHIASISAALVLAAILFMLLGAA